MAMQRKTVMKELANPEYCDNDHFVFLKNTLSEVDPASGYPKSIKRTYANVVEEIKQQEKIFKETEEDPLLRFLKNNPHLKMYNGMIIEKNTQQTIEEYDDVLLNTKTDVELPPPGSLFCDN
jgi:hypothetical protein